MSRFAFRLRALLSLRCSERDARRAELAAALARAGELAERRRDVEAEIERHRQAMSFGTAPGRLDLTMLRSARTYGAALRARLEAIAHNQLEAGAEVSHCQEALVPAEAEVRALEKLRERQDNAFRADEARREVRLSDEAAGRTVR
jgi:flagellar FliJ protein